MDAMKFPWEPTKKTPGFNASFIHALRTIQATSALSKLGGKCNYMQHIIQMHRDPKET